MLADTSKGEKIHFFTEINCLQKAVQQARFGLSVEGYVGGLSAKVALKKTPPPRLLESRRLAIQMSPARRELAFDRDPRDRVFSPRLSRTLPVITEIVEGKMPKLERAPAPGNLSFEITRLNHVF